MQLIHKAKVKIRTIKPPEIDEKECLEQLVYLCPYCVSEDVKLAKIDPIYIGSYGVSHTLGVIERHTRAERYICSSCGAKFEASTSRLHFSLSQFLKVWGGQIVLIVLAFIFAQFWDATTYENGKSVLNNWESFVALCCGIFGFTWTIVVAIISFLHD